MSTYHILRVITLTTYLQLSCQQDVEDTGNWAQKSLQRVILRLKAEQNSSTLTSDDLGREITLVCSAELHPPGYDYRDALDITWKYKKSASREELKPVGESESGIQTVKPTNGTTFLLKIAKYDPFLHDGEYQCFGKFYTMSRKGEEGKKYGRSNVAVVQLKPSATWTNSLGHTEFVFEKKEAVTFTCSIIMNPPPITIEITVNDLPISSTTVVHTETVHHSATVDVKSLKETTGSKLHCKGSNSRWNVTASETVYFTRRKIRDLSSTPNTSSSTQPSTRHNHHDHDGDDHRDHPKYSGNPIVNILVPISAVLLVALFVAVWFAMKKNSGRRSRHTTEHDTTTYYPGKGLEQRMKTNEEFVAGSNRRTYASHASHGSRGGRDGHDAHGGHGGQSRGRGQRKRQGSRGSVRPQQSHGHHYETI